MMHVFARPLVGVESKPERLTLDTQIWFADGARFRSSSDMALMKREIERWEGPEGFERYLQWLKEAHGHYELSVQNVLSRNFTGYLQLAAPAFVWRGISLHPLESIWSRASRYFWTERLRRVFTFATMYMGMSPFEAPSTYSLLQYTELAEGIWYPRGGFHVVLDALARIGKALGVEYRLNTPISKILADDPGDPKRATGVRLADGTALNADLVVVNADLVYSYSNLLPQTDEVASYAKSLRSKDASCSSISFYWSMRKKVPELGTHNIFLADEYRESFDAIFKRQSLPDDPSFVRFFLFCF
jgi:phytoene desaturase (3,4-didehydrolycopene-forming)